MEFDADKFSSLGAGAAFIAALVFCLWLWRGGAFLLSMWRKPTPRKLQYEITLSDFILLAFLTTLTLFLASKFSAFLTRYTSDEAVLSYAGTSLMNVLFILSAIAFLRFSDSKPRLFSDKFSTLIALLKGAYSMFMSLAIFLCILAIWVAILNFFGANLKEQAAVEFFKNLEPPALKISAMLAVVVLAPIWEEFFFRGFIYGAIKMHFGSAISAIVTSVFFAFIHASLYAFLPIFVLSLLFIFLYEKNGDLRVSMGAHSLFNLFNAVGLMMQ